jgi:hypothetical protein
MLRRGVLKGAGRGRGHIEEGHHRFYALGEQSRRREDLQQQRRRMRLLCVVLCAECDRCGPRSVGFGHEIDLCESCAAEGKTKAEIIRCLKRFLACEIYRIIAKSKPTLMTSPPACSSPVGAS